MIKLQELVGVPSLKYHLDNGLSLHENVYRYSSTAFIQLFTEARQAVRDGKIELNKEDTYLLENTDIGEYGEYNGMKVPLDLPMISSGKDPLFEMFNKQLKYNSRHTLNYKILNFKNTIFNDLND